MRKFIRLLLLIIAVLLTASALVVGWWLFLDGRPAPVREDLVHMPPEWGAPPAGYPTENALMAAYAMGRLELLDLNSPPPLSPTIISEKDVEYGREGDVPLLLDVYRPSNITTPRPAIVFIHGGGWVKGSRKDYTIYAQQFAEWGYVAATVGYRFSDVAKFPACVSDTKCAIRWLRANAARLGINPDQIAAAGGSGGGYLAMMLGYSSYMPELEGTGGNPGVSSAVQAVIDLYGPTDFTAPEAQNHESVVGLMGKPYTEIPDMYSKASPITRVTAGAPPTFIIQGTLDSIVPVGQSDLLAEKLKSLNVDYWYDCYPGWPHTMDKALPVTKRVQPTIRAFLEHVFGKPQVP